MKHWIGKWNGKLFSEREEAGFLKDRMLHEMEQVGLEQHLSETVLEACQTSKTELFGKIVNVLKELTILVKKAQYDAL